MHESIIVGRKCGIYFVIDRQIEPGEEIVYF